MKKGSFALTLLLGVSIALGSALVVSQKAAAQCYNGLQQQVPCPNDKKKKIPPTDIPTPIPSPVPSQQASSQATVLVTPDASQLALLCANLAPAAGGNGGPNVGGNPSPNGPTPPNTSGFAGFELGGGGLLLGILIGLLVPSILRTINGDGRGSLAPPPPGNVSETAFPPGPPQQPLGAPDMPPGPPDLQFPPGPPADKFIKGEALTGSGASSDSPVAAYDAFHKTSDNPLGSYDAFNKPGSSNASGAGAQKLGGNNFEKPGDAGLDFAKGYQKASGFQKQTDGGDIKLDKAGFQKQGGAGLGDGSVHNMDNQFQKGMDAGPGGGPNINGVNGDG